MKYISGYDATSRSYVVGKSTEYGTIAKIEFYFYTAGEAEAKVNELNTPTPEE